MPFYPNECFICHATVSLKRCSRCNMISYCGEIHQKEHWRYHKDICKVISDIMKERGVSHLYENLCIIDPKKWKAKREETRQIVESRMSRPSIVEEVEMFRYPRACFVCHEAKQDNLRNCPGCPLASFCKDHPSSFLHDKDCAIIKKSHKFETEIDPRSGLIVKVVCKIVTNTPTNIPKSIREFIDNSFKRNESLPACMQFYLAEHLTIPLSIFNAFEKLKNPSETEESVSRMVIHIRGISRRYVFTNSWESLLHMMPNLNNLSVVITDQNDNTRMEATLCNRCTSKKKKLLVEGVGMHYLEYLKADSYRNPNIVAVYNVAPPDDDDAEREMVWKIEMGVWNQLNCPLLLTTTSEKKLRMTSESLRSTFWSSRLCYEGINEFAPLYPIREWEDWGVCKNYEYMVVVKPPENNIRCPARGSFSFSKAMRDFHEPVKKPSRVFFSPNLCSICRSNSAPVVCKRCKLIFYCGEAHQKEDSIQHRDVCKIILGMVVKDRVTSIFDNLKNTDSETWLTAKIDLIKKVKNQIGRELQDFEKQMILFPKTCFICHESDLSVLTNCECGIILCKIHKDDSKHTEICSDYSSAMKLKIIEKAPSVTALVKGELFNKSDDNLPVSIESFLNIYLKINDSSSYDIPNFNKILISDALSMPLTALYALQKLKLSSKKKLKVHILGAIHREVVEEGFWVMLNWFRDLKKLELTFFDSDTSSLPLNYTTDILFHDLSFFGEKGFEVAAHKTRYDNYFRLGSAEKPHIIMGYNLNVHEIDYGISDYSWEDVILTVKKMNVPFVMTSGSEERARRDHSKLCSFLGKKVEFFSSEENPYASLFPERDFESEGLRYPNKFITIYNDFNRKVNDKFPPLANVEFDKKFNLSSSSNLLNLSFGTIKPHNPIFKVELGTENREEFGIKNSEVNIESSKLETDTLKLAKENPKLETNSPKLETKSPQLETNSPKLTIENSKIELKSPETEIVNEKKEFKIESRRSNEELLKENLLLKSINRLLMENVRLKEENERIRNENLKLKEDSEKLTAENITIKDIRQQVQESIQLALNDKK